MFTLSVTAGAYNQYVYPVTVTYIPIISGKLKDVFEMLRFDVSVQLDKTASEMTALMTYFSTQVDHAVYNCFVCFILTHGKLGKVCRGYHYTF